MGKYMRRRKCKGIGAISVMEVARDVGVRTRARALAMAAAAGDSSSRTAKRRKVGGDGGLKFASSSLIQLGSRRRVAVTPENSVSPAASGNSVSPAASCCSSNASSRVVEESSRIVDLEDESVQIQTSTFNFDIRGSRETTASSELQAESGDLESTAKLTEANSRRRSSPPPNMPSETELNEFFTAAEKGLQKRFSEKYNYDIAKDVPLEGRYEWDELKP